MLGLVEKSFERLLVRRIIYKSHFGAPASLIPGRNPIPTGSVLGKGRSVAASVWNHDNMASSTPKSIGGESW